MTEGEIVSQNLSTAKMIEKKIEIVDDLKKALDLKKKTLSCSIDDQILLAELEYRLVQEEMSLLTLQQEYWQSAALWDSSQKPDIQVQVCEVLHSYVTSLKEKGAIPALHATEHVAMENSVLVSSQGDKPSVPVVEWAHHETELQAGDRLLEVNGHSLVGKDPSEVHRILRTGDPLCRVVFLRPLSTYQLLKDTSRKEASNLRRELTSVVGRLNDKITENVSLKEQLLMLHKDLDQMKKENETLRMHIVSLENVLFLLYRLTDECTSNEKLDSLKSVFNPESKKDLDENLNGCYDSQFLDVHSLTSKLNLCSDFEQETACKDSAEEQLKLPVDSDTQN